LTRPHFRQANISLVQASRSITASRWYSTEPEAKRAGEGETAAETQEKGAEVEDPLKKELETKNKEIIDLKVCQHFQRR